ncbi:hypothetical protein [Treponema endosymbiont of Eucomonympha sp.]|uniref:hypothetical protein n=1 Tax=Treponema endosymbiont of Eucomonympha sp. TaxID=1580831 RepID=UPI0007831F46|nr:hypothetical protein [Treponema endosymbiont of Eucomonympha sp.]
MKARMKQGVSFRAFPVLSLAVLFFSCGIEDYTLLEPPSGNVVSNPTQAVERYFSFSPADNPSPPFQGTEVYYRIYASEGDRSADAASISYANTAYSSSGFNKMVSLEYEKLGFKRLDDEESSILIPKNYTAWIYIRLCTEGAEDDMSAGIRTGTATGTKIAEPLRSVKKKTFGFYRTDHYPNATDDDVPQYIDSDVKETTSSSTDGWFVNAYAVSVGQNAETLALIYSQVLHLGSIQIEKP